MSVIERELVAQALELGLHAALGSSTSPRLDRVAYGELVALRFVARHLELAEIDRRITGLLGADRRAEMEALQQQAAERCIQAA